MRMVMGKHWNDLDGLRGVLALAVVFLHFGLSSFLERTLGFPSLRLELVVDVFFILSGFVLTHSLRKGYVFLDFAIKRTMRLLPVYYVTTLVALLFVVEMPEYVWLELIIAGPLAGRDPVNFPAWSICYELYLPLIAAALPRLLGEGAVKPLLLIVLVALGLADVGVAAGERVYPVRAVLGLLAGHLLYRSQLSVGGRFDYWGGGVLLLIMLCGAMPELALAVPFVAAATVVTGVNGGSLFSQSLPQYLGRISYTLYLTHVPVLMAMQSVLGSAINQNPGFKLVGILISLAAATLLTWAIERPAMRVAPRMIDLSRRWFPIAPDAKV